MFCSTVNNSSPTCFSHLIQLHSWLHWSLRWSLYWVFVIFVLIWAALAPAHSSVSLNRQQRAADRRGQVKSLCQPYTPFGILWYGKWSQRTQRTQRFCFFKLKGKVISKSIEKLKGKDFWRNAKALVGNPGISWDHLSPGNLEETRMLRHTAALLRRLLDLDKN